MTQGSGKVFAGPARQADYGCDRLSHRSYVTPHLLWTELKQPSVDPARDAYPDWQPLPEEG